MTRVVLGQRKRAYKPKTRNGCLTCRIRRVKCGEERPHCVRCTSTGRNCDGYSLDAATHNPEPLPTQALSLKICGTEKECRSFYYFLDKTAPQLCGSFGEDFWDVLVLRASHYEPAIKHAVISIGSLHERFVANNGLIFKTDPGLSHDNFALQQYNTAIKHLVKPKKEKQAIDVCLISCILFACLENMQGSYGSAISHVRSGRKILGEVQYNDKKRHHDHLEVTANPYIPIQALESIFMRLELAIFEIVGGHDYTIFKNCARIRGFDNIPERFSNFQEARDYLVYGWYLVSGKTQDRAKLEVSEQIKQFVIWQKESIYVFERWSNALENLIQHHEESMTNKEKSAAAILEIQKHLCFITLHLDRGPIDDQTLFDEFNPLYEKIVGLCAQALGYIEEGPSFSLDMEIIGPLYVVAESCRDPKIRRQAISLLQSKYRQEGVWNAFLTAKVAQRIIDIEEEGLGEVRSSADVPDWARISHINPQFDPVERKGTITYSRMGSKSEVVRKTVEEIIEW